MLGRLGWQPEQAGRRSEPCEVAVVRGEACAWARGVQAQGAEAAVRRRREAAGSAGQHSLFLPVTVEATALKRKYFLTIRQPVTRDPCLRLSGCIIKASELEASATSILSTDTDSSREKPTAV